MTPEEEAEVSRAIKEAIRRARGYADFFGWAPNRDLEELGVATSLGESLQRNGARFFTHVRVRGRGNDPPDLEGLDMQGRRVAFEVTELVDGQAIREYKSGRRYGFAEWTGERFIDELNGLLVAKNSKLPNLPGAPYEGGYVVVVFTDEPDLSAAVVRQYLGNHRFAGLRNVSRAFFVISYDPSLKMCPYFEIAHAA